jgi:iron complex transport system ATP-binding protein
VTSLRFHQVAVRYGRRLALAPLDLTVATGTWTCIIGRNGAGKSSALRAAAGLVRHDGTVSADDSPLPSAPRLRATLVAYVPQSPLIADSMSAFDYVLLGRSAYVGYFGTESAKDRAIVADTLSRLDMADFADRPMGTLSGGERQRLVIARAVAQQAKVLLLDEPTSALDIGHQQQALELVEKMSHECGFTVLSVTHDLTLAGMYADQLVVLDGGRVHAAGTPAEVLTGDVLSGIYGSAVRVHHADDGTILVAPRRIEARSPPEVSLGEHRGAE